MLYWLHELHGYTHGRLQLSPRCWSLSNRQEKMWQDVAQPWPIPGADGKAVEAPLNIRVSNYSIVGWWILSATGLPLLSLYSKVLCWVIDRQTNSNMR